jgi:hypothetical protein
VTRRACKRCGRVEPPGGMVFAARYLAAVPEWRCVNRAACHAHIERAGQLTIKAKAQ